ncbi:protein phosphatase 2C domain-containing protein [Thalassobacillus hwangdonensis]|uniref:Protein phosphatase 2C domain-containing protein n=1 Tax=Thalassobacillus hwangdonensis TaxID=546108 RepID=A0ABW3L031_9BACI
MTKSSGEFNWVGSQNNFVDNINIGDLKYISIGRFGGNSTAGQYKNEDGCLVWVSEKEDWEFAVILDAHNSDESARLVVEQFVLKKKEIQHLLSLPYDQALKRLEQEMLDLFQEEAFMDKCRNAQGETACLVLFRKDKYIWWFSVGDCLSYLFHSDLAKLGQYQINQRQFYEWVGQVNTFEKAVPCYSKGVRELRKGMNRILMTTDGLIECPNEPFSSPKVIYHVMKNGSIKNSLMTLFQTVKENNVRDSTTIISWDVTITEDVTIPSDQ